jgi:hypothetical protein
MEEMNLTLVALAERTRMVDPDGRGVSFQLISFLSTTRESARQTTSPKSAGLIARALECAEDRLFERSEVTRGHARAGKAA